MWEWIGPSLWLKSLWQGMASGVIAAVSAVGAWFVWLQNVFINVLLTYYPEAYPVLVDLYQFVDVVDGWFPLKHAVIAFVSFWQIWTAVIILRWTKSFIPTLSN